MLGIVLVNYKSHYETVRYVQKELPKIGIPYKLVIVNNAATNKLNQLLVADLDAELVPPGHGPRDVQHSVFVIDEPENLGYARGNNLGAWFLMEYFSIDWLLVTNNDLILDDADVVKKLIDIIQAKPDVGAIGPKVVGLDGIDQSPHRYLSIWASLIVPKLLYPFVFPLLHMGVLREVLRNAAEGNYYRIMGSFMLIRPDAFRKTKGFDPATFLYAEEQILSERMKQHGYQMYYYPKRRVIHNHGQTTSVYLTRKSTCDLVFQSLLYYYQTYKGASPIACEIARLSHYVYFYFYNPVLSWLRQLLSGIKRNHSG